MAAFWYLELNFTNADHIEGSTNQSLVCFRLMTNKQHIRAMVGINIVCEWLKNQCDFRPLRLATACMSTLTEVSPPHLLGHLYVGPLLLLLLSSHSYAEVFEALLSVFLMLA